METINESADGDHLARPTGQHADERPASGSKNSPRPTTRSRTPVWRSRSLRRKAAVRRSIPRATNLNSAPILRCASKRTRSRKLNSTRPFASTASSRKTSTPVFYPGGHGPMWDLAEDKHSIKLIESFIAAGKHIGIGLPFHRRAASRQGADGKLLVQGKEGDRLHRRRGRRGRPHQDRPPSWSKTRC